MNDPTMAVATPAETPAGSIYDIGYRRYEGPRLGRAHAVRSMFSYSLRSAYGIGRGTRAKIAPLLLLTLAAIPAIAILAALALLRQFPGGEAFEEELPIRYDTYFGTITTFLILFCAAQAPELFGRDQRHSLLALYFARALRRTDYALARIGGLVAALLIFLLVPQAILFLGRVLLSADVLDGVAGELPALAPLLGQAALAALLLGGLSMAVSAFTPRRAYAVAGIIALFIIPSIVAGVVVGLGSRDVGRWLVLLSPTSILDGTNAFLFDTPLGGSFEGIALGLPDVAYFAAAAVGIVGSIAISIRRLARLTA
ncbi:MAG: ABC transporter permease [Chloroflexi bacterium]|nr:ABC transporter permease [Chloroflexota bacterium]